MYAIAHLPDHLIDVVRNMGDDVLGQALPTILMDLSFGYKKTASLGVDSFIADLREAILLMPNLREGHLRDLLGAVDGIAHELRLWNAAEAPSRFDQQLLLRAQHSGLNWLADKCTERLKASGTSYVKASWRASKESPAIERVMAGHQDNIKCLVLTEDEKYVISASKDGTGRMWNLSTGEVVSIFQGATSPLLCLSSCVAGMVVLGDKSGRAWLWDLRTLDVRQLVSLDAPICSVHLTHDGALAVSVDQVGTIAISRVDGADTRMVSCGGPLGDVMNMGGKPVTWLTDDKRVLIGLKDGRIEAWDYIEGRLDAVLEGHADEVAFIAVSDDCKLAASSANSDVRSAFDDSNSDDILIWNLDYYRLVRSLDDSAGQCFGMAFRNGTLSLVTAHLRYGVIIWDLQTGRPNQLPLPAVMVHRIALSSDGRFALTTAVTDEFLVRVWDLDSRRQISMLYGHGLNISAICITHGGRRVVTGSADRTIRVWSMDRLEAHGARAGHTGPVTALYAFPERDLVFSGSMDDTLRAWSLSTGLQLDIYSRRQLTTAAIAPLNSSLFITGSTYGTIEAWPFPIPCQTRLEPRRLPAEVASVSGLVYLPALKRIVVTSYHAGDIFMWDSSNGEELAELRGHQDNINSIAPAKGGQLLITTSNDETVRIWETGAGNCKKVLNGHGCAVRGVAISPGDRLIVSSAVDGSLIVWDLESGNKLGQIDGSGTTIYSVSITPDGAYIVAGDSLGWLRIWTLDTTPELKISVLLDSEIEFVQALHGRVVAGNASGSLYCLEYC